MTVGTGLATPLRLHPPSVRVLALRLQALHPLGPQDVALLDNLPRNGQPHRTGAAIEQPGDRIVSARIILSGWACQAHLLPDGRQQIIRILLPGDITGLCLQPAPLAQSSLIALTPVETIAAGPLSEVMRSDQPTHAGLRAALAIAGALDAAYSQVQVIRLGRQTALERVASLLLELRDRLLAVGLGQRSQFPMPLVQETLANTLGLSAVHLNRTVQQLRKDRLIVMRNGMVELLNAEQLTQLADYVPPRVSAAMPGMVPATR